MEKDVLKEFEAFVERNYQGMPIVIIKDAIEQFRKKLRLDNAHESPITNH